VRLRLLRHHVHDRVVHVQVVLQVLSSENKDLSMLVGAASVASVARRPRSISVAQMVSAYAYSSYIFDWNKFIECFLKLSIYSHIRKVVTCSLVNNIIANVLSIITHLYSNY
jgi:hypothetical protein